MIGHPSLLCDAHGDEDTKHAVDMHPFKPTDPGSVNDDRRPLAVALRRRLRLVPCLPAVAGCRAEADVLCNLETGDKRVGSSAAKKWGKK